MFKHSFYNENKTKKHRKTCKQQFITYNNYIIFDTWSGVGISGSVGTAITLAKLGHEHRDEKNTKTYGAKMEFLWLPRVKLLSLV